MILLKNYSLGVKH